MTTPTSNRSRTTERLVQRLARDLPDVRVTAYDGCASGPACAATTICLNSPSALAQIIRAPRGLGLARAWVSGQIDVRGDWYSLARHEDDLRDPGLILATFRTALRVAPKLRSGDLKATGPTSIEYRRIRPGAHTIDRDLDEVDFHYGLSAEFYRHLLGPSMTYSGGIFAAPADSLEQAQDNKHRIICEKLQLDNRSMVLDIGCGWGAFLRYATASYGCSGIGVTASRAQYSAMRQPGSKTAGQRIDVICGDYRQALPLTTITAATSIGMYEHVGARNSAQFFARTRSRLKRGSRYVNQAIIRREDGPARFRRNSFAQRYIFPNAQLLPLSRQLQDLQAADFTVKSVEFFGDSYALTIRQWLKNLEGNWQSCADLEGEQRVRAWYVYLLGSLARFESRAIDLAQVLAEAR